MEIKLISWFDDRFYKVTYEKDNKEITDYIPSVTTKLNAVAKPFLSRWRGDLGNREADFRMKEQAERGARIHFAWQILNTGGAVIYNPFYEPIYSREKIIELEKQYNTNIIEIKNQDEMYQIDKLKRFYSIIKPASIYCEMIVYDIENRDAGTIDNVWTIKEGSYQVNGKEPIKLKEGIYIIDIKTGNYLGREAKMQTSAYTICYEKMMNLDVIGVLIVHTAAQTRSGIEGLKTIYLNRKQISEAYDDYKNISAVWEKQFANLKPTLRTLPSLLTLN